MSEAKHTPGPTFTCKTMSQSAAIVLAVKLIHTSAWFSLTPLSDDEWEFELKNEPHLLIMAKEQGQ